MGKSRLRKMGEIGEGGGVEGEGRLEQSEMSKWIPGGWALDGLSVDVLVVRAERKRWDEG